MANFQHGHTFSEHSIRDPDAFNANVDAAQINNVGNADLATGVRLPTTVQPGSPITGEVYVNDAQDVFFFGQKTAHPLQFFYSGIWNDQEADLRFLTLTNNSAVDLVAGDVVVQDPADVGGFIIPTILHDHNTKPLGVLLDDIASGVSGRVAYYGVVLLNLSGIFSPQSAGFRVGLVDGTGGFYSQNIATKGTIDIDGYDNVFGVLLTDAVSNQAFAFIWK
jgi:hypothetical protein